MMFKFNIKLYAILITVITVQAGCAYFVSWDEAVEGGVGRTINSIIKLDGPPTSVKSLSGGNKEYKYHFKKIDPSCVHYWVVNSQGIITGYHYQGRCRPIG